jgi:hypothetical protein
VVSVGRIGGDRMQVLAQPERRVNDSSQRLKYLQAQAIYGGRYLWPTGASRVDDHR